MRLTFVIFTEVFASELIKLNAITTNAQVMTIIVWDSTAVCCHSKDDYLSTTPVNDQPRGAPVGERIASFSKINFLC